VRGVSVLESRVDSMTLLMECCGHHMHTSDARAKVNRRLNRLRTSHSLRRCIAALALRLDAGWQLGIFLYPNKIKEGTYLLVGKFCVDRRLREIGPLSDRFS
jgi:hypothetical protein